MRLTLTSGSETLAFILIAPLLGMLLAYVIMMIDLLALPEFIAQANGRLLSEAAACFRSDLQLCAWDERCAEDDGHHHRRAVHDRHD